MIDFEHEWLGLVEYADGLVLQEQAVQARNDDPTLPDKLMLLEHPHTYTFGVRRNRHHLLLGEAQLAEQQIAVYDVNRGGDITYHGPGQLVGYPIFNVKRSNSHLGNRPFDVRSFMQNIENCIIQTLKIYGVMGWRDKQHPGVWVDFAGTQAKIAAVGVHINRHRISSHGFALNIQPDLHYFKQIVPCGIEAYPVTSLAEVLKRPLSIQEVLPKIVSAFYEIFQFKQTSQAQIEETYVHY